MLSLRLSTCVKHESATVLPMICMQAGADRRHKLLDHDQIYTDKHACMHFCTSPAQFFTHTHTAFHQADKVDLGCRVLPCTYAGWQQMQRLPCR